MATRVTPLREKIEFCRKVLRRDTGTGASRRTTRWERLEIFLDDRPEMETVNQTVKMRY